MKRKLSKKLSLRKVTIANLKPLGVRLSKEEIALVKAGAYSEIYDTCTAIWDTKLATMCAAYGTISCGCN